MIKELLTEIAELDTVKHIKDKTIYVTQVCQCLRKSFYELTMPIVDINDVFRKHLVIGSSIHLYIQKLLSNYCGELGYKCRIEVPIEFEYNNYKILGRADAVINDVVVEFKTTVKDVKIPNMLHLMQTNLYTHILGLNKYVVVYVTPNDILEFNYTFNNELLNMFMRRLNILVNALNSMNVPSPEEDVWCKNCLYKHLCVKSLDMFK